MTKKNNKRLIKNLLRTANNNEAYDSANGGTMPYCTTKQCRNASSNYGHPVRSL